MASTDGSETQMCVLSPDDRLQGKYQERGIIAQWQACFLLVRVAPGLIPIIPKFLSDKKNVDVAEVNKWRCLEESGQWLENVYQTHLLLTSGKLVLQKSILVCNKSM